MTVELSAVRTFSFELFPPKTEDGKAKLRTTWHELARLKPRFFSVTFGAGGSTQQGTLDTVLDIRAAGEQAAPHISCVAASKADILETLSNYREHGIRHIVALRGDMPSGLASGGELRYANELVDFIRQTTGDWFHIDVACYPEYHPQTRNPSDELKNFKLKVDAGADSAITQYFYNPDAYFQLGLVLIQQATEEGGKMKAPAGTAEAFQKYLELASAKERSDPATQALARLCGITG